MIPEVIDYKKIYGKAILRLTELRLDMEKDMADFESMGQMQAQIEILKEILGIDDDDGIENHWFDKRAEMR